MKPVNKIVLLSPGKDNLLSGPDTVWLDQLIVNLDLVFRKYTGNGLKSITPESKDAAETLDRDVFLVLLMHQSYESAGKYLKFLEKAATESKGNIKQVIRIDTSSEIGDKIPELFSRAASVELYDTDGAQGAARGAGLGAGVYKNYEEAMVGLRSTKVIEPTDKLSAAYKGAYENWLQCLQKELAGCK